MYYRRNPRECQYLYEVAQGGLRCIHGSLGYISSADLYTWYCLLCKRVGIPDHGHHHQPKLDVLVLGGAQSCPKLFSTCAGCGHASNSGPASFSGCSSLSGWVHTGQLCMRNAGFVQGSIGANKNLVNLRFCTSSGWRRRISMILQDRKYRHNDDSQRRPSHALPVRSGHDAQSTQCPPRPLEPCRHHLDLLGPGEG